MPDPQPNYVSITTWPDDFQQLLTDLLNFDIPPSMKIPVFVLPIEPHFNEWDELCPPDESGGDGWSADDFDRAEEFVDAITRGTQFPPLIVDTKRGLLRDGYHRLYALRKLGITEYQMILLDKCRSHQQQLTQGKLPGQATDSHC